MFSNYILYFVISTNYGVAINTIEFPSKISCQNAIVKLKENNPDFKNTFTCVRQAN
jgi:hypothetical protein